METLHASAESGGLLLLTFTGSIIDPADVKKLKGDIATVSKRIQDFHKSEGHSIKILIDITHLTAEYIEEGVDALVELARQDKTLVE
jgi:hypothetical protein